MRVCVDRDCGYRRPAAHKLADRQLGLSFPAWQILCVVATLCSLAAATATQLLKSHNVDERVARAQTARAKLDIIRFGLATGQTTEAHAADEYNASVELSSFITSRM
jgi:hypothetical protein